MNFEHYHIYRVEGAEQLKTCADFLKEVQALQRRRSEWSKSQGGIGTIDNGYSVRGLLAKPGAVLAAGWKRATREGWNFPPNESFVPDRRIKAGKAVAKEMGAFGILRPSALASRLGAGRSFLRAMDRGMAIMDSQCYQRGSEWILLVPINGDKPAPKIAGCKLLKLSEFYAMKERSEKKTKKAVA